MLITEKSFNLGELPLEAALNGGQKGIKSANPIIPLLYASSINLKK